MPGETGYGLANIAHHGADWFLVINYARWWLDSMGRQCSSISGPPWVRLGKLTSFTMEVEFWWHLWTPVLNERPTAVILPFGSDLEITTLSAVKTVDETLSQENETTYVAETLWEIQQEAHWILLSRLVMGQGFQFVPVEQTDALAE
jgi:hypothetical protein